MAQKVSVEDVERVAELAHLELAPDEMPGMVRDLNAILDYVAELNELDTSGVAPLAQVSELDGAGCRKLPAPGHAPAVARPRCRDVSGAGNRRLVLQSAEGD